MFFCVCVCVENTGLVVNNKAPKATGLVLLHINKYKMHLILIELSRENCTLATSLNLK